MLCEQERESLLKSLGELCERDSQKGLECFGREIIQNQKIFERKKQWVLSILTHHIEQDCAVYQSCVQEIFWQKCCLALAKRHAYDAMRSLLQILLSCTPQKLLEIVQSKLAAVDAVFIDYFTIHPVAGETSKDSYVMLVVSPKFNAILPIPNTREVRFHLEQFARAGKSTFVGGRKIHGVHLRERLVDPVLQRTRCKKMLLSPDEVLFDLPFQNLPLNSSTVFDHVQVTYVAEACDLINCSDFHGPITPCTSLYGLRCFYPGCGCRQL